MEGSLGVECSCRSPTFAWNRGYVAPLVSGFAEKSLRFGDGCFEKGTWGLIRNGLVWREGLEILHLFLGFVLEREKEMGRSFLLF